MAKTVDPESTPPGEEPKKARSDKDILEEARMRLKDRIEEYEEERRKQKDDLLFSTLEQWPSDVRSARENDPNGARPCLTIDQINQYIVQVVNDMRQNRPAVKVRPVDDNADLETAEVFQGIVRQIEDQSSAQVAYATAGESAVRVGEGYFRFLTEYEDETSFDQVIKIQRIPDMFCVYLGPHQMPDGSDSEFGFVYEDLPLEVFRRKWPDAKYRSTDFDELHDYASYWHQDKNIRVAEYFYTDYEKATVCLYADGTTAIKRKGEKPEGEVIDERETRIPTVKWVKMTGVEILEKRDWAGKYIPIVKVIGKEAWVDGKRCNWGLVRPAKDSLRMYNYWASTITEKIALAPKTPFIGAKGQFEGVEDRWQMANVYNYPYLEYNPTTIDGNAVPPPQRQAPAPMEVAMVQQLQQIREDVQASLGMFKASLGKEQPNQSGKAILALTRESDTGTFHFADNQSLSIQHGGRILIDLIPKIYDTKRVVKILGEDGKMKTAQLDPEAPTSMSRVADPMGKVQSIYNLGVGTYDVTVTVGPSFNTKRMEAATMFTDLANTSKDPVSGTVMRYLAIKNSDIPGRDEAAEMMEKLLPPGIVKQEGQPNVPPQVMAAMAQMKQIIQVQGQKVQELESGAKVDQMKIGSQHDAKMKELDLKKIEQDREAVLAKEKAEADFAVKKWVAEQNADLERDVANAEHGVEKQRVEMERQKMNQEIKDKQDAKVAEEALPLAENVMPKFIEAIEKITQVFTQSMQENTQVMMAVAQAAGAEREAVIMRDKSGNITGASSKIKQQVKH